MKTLRLRIESILSLDDASLALQPFALWEVVDQSLLHHWFDFAVDQGFGTIRLHCPKDQSELFRAVLASATLWPIRIQLSDETDSEKADFTVDHLPFSDPSSATPKSEVDWLVWHSKLNSIRLNHLWEHLVPTYPYLVRGHRAIIHPSATLQAPYWIGAGARIGADTQIGPNTCIGGGTNIAKGCTLKNTSVAPGIVLAAGTHFTNHVVHPNIIFNHKMRIIHPSKLLEDAANSALAA